MTKLKTILATFTGLIMGGLNSHAAQRNPYTMEPAQWLETAAAIDVLIKNNIIKPSTGTCIEIDPSIVNQLKAEGLLKSLKSEELSLCPGGK